MDVLGLGSPSAPSHPCSPQEITTRKPASQPQWPFLQEGCCVFWLHESMCISCCLKQSQGKAHSES